MLSKIWIRNLATLDVIDKEFFELMVELTPLLADLVKMPIVDILICGSLPRNNFIPQRSDMDLIVLVQKNNYLPREFSVSPTALTSKLAHQIFKIDVSFQYAYSSNQIRNFSDLIRVCDSVSLFFGIKYDGLEIEKFRLLNLLTKYQKWQEAMQGNSEWPQAQRDRFEAKKIARQYQLTLLRDRDFFCFSLPITLERCYEFYSASRNAIDDLQFLLGYKK